MSKCLIGIADKEVILAAFSVLQTEFSDGRQKQ